MPLRPEVHGTERPLQNHVAIVQVAFVEAARFLGGQLFVLINEFDPHLKSRVLEYYALFRYAAILAGVRR